MSRRLGIIIGIIIIAAFIGALVWKEYQMKDHVKVCAKFVRTFKGKSAHYYEFEYPVGDTVMRGIRSAFGLKVRDADKLKQLDCIEIIYAESAPTNIRIIDKRVGDERFEY